MSLIDIQNSDDNRNLAIQKVGINSIKHPIKVVAQNGDLQASIGKFSMAVGLNKTSRATHMSRFVEILNQQEWTITRNTVNELLDIICQTLGTDSAFVEIEFDFFVNKLAPVTKAAGLVDYKIKYIGEKINSVLKINLELTIPITTLCPCSKAISSAGAHNQRGYVILTVELNNAEDLALEKLITLVEKQGSSEIFSTIKRPDEKHVTEAAYNNAKFVEDVVRDVAIQLQDLEGIGKFSIAVENIESIHNHNAFAIISNF